MICRVIRYFIGNYFPSPHFAWNELEKDDSGRITTSAGSLQKIYLKSPNKLNFSNTFLLYGVNRLQQCKV
jgi:hypothetical protein